MRSCPLARVLALAFALVLPAAPLARAQDANPGTPDAALASAERATNRAAGDGPRAAGKKREERLARRHDRIMSVLGQLSEPVAGGEANGLELTANGGATRVDLAHAETGASVGLVNGVDAQVSAVEVRQAVGPVGLEADALTAKASAEVGIEGLGASVGLTLAEAGADLGPVDGSVGFGLGASAQLGLHGVDLELGLGVQASVSVDPVGAATDVWNAIGGLFHHHHDHKAASPASPKGSAVAGAPSAERGITECLPLQGK